MILLRGYLLLGLIAHKVVWEVLKRRQGCPTIEKSTPRSIRPMLIKAVKVGILLGIGVQTVVWEVLPIMPDSINLHIVGTVFYTVGLFVAILGRIQLGGNWADIETAQVLPNQTVVSKGLYRYIRHPIYVGDLLLLLGLQLSLNSWLVLGVGLIVPVVLWKAVCEERMLVKTLPGYAEYCRITKRFIPFVI